MADQRPIQKTEQKETLARWNRTEVNRYLLPVLRYVDPIQNEELSPREQQARRAYALQACAAHPEAYRQMIHVYQGGSPSTKQMWFGWIECEGELLDEAFSFIGRALDGEEVPTGAVTFAKTLNNRYLLRYLASALSWT